MIKLNMIAKKAFRGWIPLCLMLTISVSLVSLSSSLTASPSTFLDQRNVERIKEVIKIPSNLASIQLANIFFSLESQSLLSVSVPATDSANICSHLQSQINDQLETIFFATSAAKLLTNCKISAAQYVKKLEGYLKEDSTVQELYRASNALLNLGQPVDLSKLSKFLALALKKDETLLNTGLAFQLASRFTKAEDRNPFVEKIGDVVVQADEVDGRFLQFEGGLGITASIILGVYQLAAASNKPVGLTNDQALKFANYFLSRKYVLTHKGIAELLQVLKLYTNNKFHIPIVITNYGSNAISSSNPVLSVKITNVLGASLGQLSVVADSATRIEDKKVIWTKKSLQPVQGDSTLFALNFLESKPPRGFYDIAISVSPSKPDPRFIGINGNVVKALVLTQVSVINAEISVADRDAGGTGAVTKLEYPSLLTNPLEADYQQRLVLKFQLRDVIAGDVLTAHQTFVQFVNSATKQEIIFVAEADSTSTYKLDLNLQTKAKDLFYLSGVYRITLIVGDAVISNPIEWKIGSINLQLPPNPNPSPSDASVSPYLPRPEIKHLFREQEKRPPPVVSNAFSLLALVPLVILLALWLKIGINLSAFPFTLSALVFHLGLALIFLLYVCFFIKLNMFETCKYLAGIGLITFLAGHSLLSRLASNKNK